MEQSLVECFNQATTFNVGNSTIGSFNRIKNLVANISAAKVAIDDSIATIKFITPKKDKTALVMTYTISRELLTDQQVANLIAASLPKVKAQ